MTRSNKCEDVLKNGNEAHLNLNLFAMIENIQKDIN
jgi:hypothetical protein